jgi:hypothetical protein
LSRRVDFAVFNIILLLIFGRYTLLQVPSASDEANFNYVEYESLKFDCRHILETVLNDNGDISLIGEVIASAQNEDEYSMIFHWINVEPFVEQVISDPPPLACPLTLPVPLTVETFKTALLNYLQEPVAATQPIGTSVLQGNQIQFSHAVSAATLLNSDPWFMAVAGSVAGLVPIAEVLIMGELMIGTAMSPHVKAAGARLWK